jgi:hypothetical protein
MDIKEMLGPRVRRLACWMQGKTRERQSGNRLLPQCRVIIQHIFPDRDGLNRTKQYPRRQAMRARRWRRSTGRS